MVGLINELDEGLLEKATKKKIMDFKEEEDESMMKLKKFTGRR